MYRTEWTFQQDFSRRGETAIAGWLTVGVIFMFSHSLSKCTEHHLVQFHWIAAVPVFSITFIIIILEWVGRWGVGGMEIHVLVHTSTNSE